MAKLIFDATVVPPWVAGAKPEQRPVYEEVCSHPKEAMDNLLPCPVADPEPLPATTVLPVVNIEPEQPQVAAQVGGKRRGRPPGKFKRTFADFPEGFSQERDLEREAYTAREEWRAAIQLRKDTLEAMNEDVRRKAAYAQHLEKKIFASKFKK